jgi:hypothetical protein
LGPSHFIGRGGGIEGILIYFTHMEEKEISATRCLEKKKKIEYGALPEVSFQVLVVRRDGQALKLNGDGLHFGFLHWSVLASALEGFNIYRNSVAII